MLPTARSFSLSGTAHLNVAAEDPAIDTALGLPGPDAGRDHCRREREPRQPEGPRRRARSTVTPTTAWNSRSRDLPGQWVEVTNSVPVRFDHLDLQLRDDGRHSVPTQLRVSTEDGTTRVVAVPPTAPVDGIAHVTVPFEPLEGAHGAHHHRRGPPGDDPRRQPRADHPAGRADRSRDPGHPARAAAGGDAVDLSHRRRPGRRRIPGRARDRHHRRRARRPAAPDRPVRRGVARARCGLARAARPGVAPRRAVGEPVPPALGCPGRRDRARRRSAPRSRRLPERRRR